MEKRFVEIEKQYRGALFQQRLKDMQRYAKMNYLAEIKPFATQIKNRRLLWLEDILDILHHADNLGVELQTKKKEINLNVKKPYKNGEAGINVSATIKVRLKDKLEVKVEQFSANITLFNVLHVRRPNHTGEDTGYDDNIDTNDIIPSMNVLIRTDETTPLLDKVINKLIKIGLWQKFERGLSK